jgi:hypothetical protein
MMTPTEFIYQHKKSALSRRLAALKDTLPCIVRVEEVRIGIPANTP